MIERVILLKLTDPSARDAVADEVRAALGEAGGVEVRVGVPADPPSEVWDVIVVLRVPEGTDVAALDRRVGHGDPRVVVRKAWTFRTSP